MRDYISVIRECSLWILIRDSLCPIDILSLRTAGRKWNNAKVCGEYAALWFFLMAKNEEVPPVSEWPNLCFDCRQNFGFVPSTTESGEWSDMIAFGCAGSGPKQKRELEVGNQKSTHSHTIDAVSMSSGLRCEIVGIVSRELHGYCDYGMRARFLKILHTVGSAQAISAHEKVVHLINTFSLCHVPLHT